MTQGIGPFGGDHPHPKIPGPEKDPSTQKTFKLPNSTGDMDAVKDALAIVDDLKKSSSIIDKIMRRGEEGRMAREALQKKIDSFIGDLEKIKNTFPGIDRSQVDALLNDAKNIRNDLNNEFVPNLRTRMNFLIFYADDLLKPLK